MRTSFESAALAMDARSHHVPRYPRHIPTESKLQMAVGDEAGKRDVYDYIEEYSTVATASTERGLGLFGHSDGKVLRCVVECVGAQRGRG